jgi:hypothetical protein
MMSGTIACFDPGYHNWLDTQGLVQGPPVQSIILD